jgi:hypothetical protein
MRRTGIGPALLAAVVLLGACSAAIPTGSPVADTPQPTEAPTDPPPSLVPGPSPSPTIDIRTLREAYRVAVYTHNRRWEAQARDFPADTVSDRHAYCLGMAETERNFVASVTALVFPAAYVTDVDAMLSATAGLIATYDKCGTAKKLGRIHKLLAQRDAQYAAARPLFIVVGLDLQLDLDPLYP